MLILAQLAISAWLNWNGEEPPSAADIACTFPEQKDWVAEVRRCWSECCNGQPLSASSLDKAVQFWGTLHSLKDMCASRIAEEVSQEALSAREGLALLRNKGIPGLAAFLSLKDLVPNEVRRLRYPLPGHRSGRKPPATQLPGKLSEGESFLLLLCTRAKHLSKHYGLLLHQCSSGVSDHFPSTWRNVTGNMEEQKVHALIHSWRRWEDFISHSPSQWSQVTEHEALFHPPPGALAHYAGVRSLGGDCCKRGHGRTRKCWPCSEKVRHFH